MSFERRTKCECFICHSTAGNTFSDIVRHIGYVHAHDPNFNVVCGIEGCTRSYINFMSYRRHLYREHKHFIGTENGEGASDDNSDHQDMSEPMSVILAGGSSSVSAISQESDIISPFSDMETTYQHPQYFKAHLHMNVRDTY